MIKVSGGEHSSDVECSRTTTAGVSGKANVGISNDEGGENPPRRKSKVSRAMPVIPGSVGS